MHYPFRVQFSYGWFVLVSKLDKEVSIDYKWSWLMRGRMVR